MQPTHATSDMPWAEARLGAYLREKGGNWEQVDRDKKSGGLMKFVFEFTLAGPTVKNVLELRVPESRHGVLYLWQNADISTQWAKIFLEGALTVGGSTLGLLQAGNYRAGDQFQGLGVIAKDSPGDTAASVGRLAPTIGGIVAPPKGTGVRVETPTPVVKLADLPDDARLVAAGVSDKNAREWARQIVGKFGKLKSDKKSDKDEDLQIEQLAHFSPEEVEAVEELAQDCASRNAGPTEEELNLLRTPRKAADIAMFGRMLAAIDQHGIKPVVDRIVALDAIADAHRYVETGRKRGGVVVAVAA